VNHQDHVRLLRDGVRVADGVWADFGSGDGAFTLALADLLGPEAQIYSVDREAHSLERQEISMALQFPDARVTYLVADFTRPLDLSPLDGIVMANSLHFQRDKEDALALALGYLKPGGRLLLVEYNSDHGNMWVPYPLSYPTWEKLASANGFVQTRLLATTPSRFLREIYSAESLKPHEE
jgi:ubiquinone/menaquinone biosynthesis C-methylase UbiE